jgi:hypothetical protein
LFSLEQQLLKRASTSGFETDFWFDRSGYLCFTCEYHVWSRRKLRDPRFTEGCDAMGALQGMYSSMRNNAGKRITGLSDKKIPAPWDGFETVARLQESFQHVEICVRRFQEHCSGQISWCQYYPERLCWSESLSHSTNCSACQIRPRSKTSEAYLQIQFVSLCCVSCSAISTRYKIDRKTG